MKKILTLVVAVLMSFSVANAENIKVNTQDKQNMNPQKMEEIKAQREAAFEKRLGLTEEQKIKAREIRFKGHFELGPVMQDIYSKKQEAKMVKMSRIAVEEQEKRLAQIEQKLKILEKNAREIRKKNMKEFESILTKKQKKILKQMKKEGRKKYKTAHPLNFNKNTLK